MFRFVPKQIEIIYYHLKWQAVPEMDVSTLARYILRYIIFNTGSLLPSFYRLLNSNTFTTISDDAFAGLSHLQYLWVFLFMLLNAK